MLSVSPADRLQGTPGPPPSSLASPRQLLGPWGAASSWGSRVLGPGASDCPRGQIRRALASGVGAGEGFLQGHGAPPSLWGALGAHWCWGQVLTGALPEWTPWEGRSLQWAPGRERGQVTHGLVQRLRPACLGGRVGSSHGQLWTTGGRLCFLLAGRAGVQRVSPRTGGHDWIRGQSPVERQGPPEGSQQQRGVPAPCNASQAPRATQRWLAWAHPRPAGRQAGRLSEAPWLHETTSVTHTAQAAHTAGARLYTPHLSPNVDLVPWGSLGPGLQP